MRGRQLRQAGVDGVVAPATFPLDSHGGDPIARPCRGSTSAGRPTYLGGSTIDGADALTRPSGRRGRGAVDRELAPLNRPLVDQVSFANSRTATGPPGRSRRARGGDVTLEGLAAAFRRHDPAAGTVVEGPAPSGSGSARKRLPPRRARAFAFDAQAAPRIWSCAGDGSGGRWRRPRRNIFYPRALITL